MTTGQTSGPALIAEALSRSFDGEPAIDALDLRVEEGQVHALVGLNGSGKTTLMRLFLGMMTPNSGRALVFGHPPDTAPPQLWREVGHMIETPFAYPELTTRENVHAAARLRGLNRQDAHEAVDQIVDQLGLGRWGDRRSGTLSLGNRQRLGLACATVHRPMLLVLDEPTSALDPTGVVLVRDLLRSEADERGISVLVSSHHLDEIARIAHRISVLHRGRLVGLLDPNGADLERQFFELVYAAEATHAEGVH